MLNPLYKLAWERFLNYLWNKGIYSYQVQFSYQIPFTYFMAGKTISKAKMRDKIIAVAFLHNWSIYL